jgi:hypothetical protein
MLFSIWCAQACADSAVNLKPGMLPIYLLCAHAMPLTLKRLAGLNCPGSVAALLVCVLASFSHVAPWESLPLHLQQSAYALCKCRSSQHRCVQNPAGPLQTFTTSSLHILMASITAHASAKSSHNNSAGNACGRRGTAHPVSTSYSNTTTRHALSRSPLNTSFRGCNARTVPHRLYSTPAGQAATHPATAGASLCCSRTRTRHNNMQL